MLIDIGQHLHIVSAAPPSYCRRISAAGFALLRRRSFHARRRLPRSFRFSRFLSAPPSSALPVSSQISRSRLSLPHRDLAYLRISAFSHGNVRFSPPDMPAFRHILEVFIALLEGLHSVISFSLSVL